MRHTCTSFKLAKELKKHGFPQDGVYRWEKDDKGKISTCIGWIPISDHKEAICAAPLAEEILKELPVIIKRADEIFNLRIFRDIYSLTNPKEFYIVSYETLNGTCLNAPDNFDGEADKLSDALAEEWLYLKKEGDIK